MILIKNYEKYMNDKVLVTWIETFGDLENAPTQAVSKRLFEELKQQLNEVDKYQLKLKALEDNIEFLRHQLTIERNLVESLRKK